MRLVVDTDVMVAAVRSDSGASRHLLVAGLVRRFTWLVSVPLLIEYEAVMTREPICKTCNHDPTNRVIDDLRAIESGELAAGHERVLIDEMANLSAAFSSALERLRPGVTAPVPVAAPRRKIPIQAV